MDQCSVNQRHYIRPQWPAPANIRAFVSSRQGGVSQPPFDSFNLANHVGDAEAAVRANRALLATDCALDQVFWLQQVHGTEILEAKKQPDKAGTESGLQFGMEFGLWAGSESGSGLGSVKTPIADASWSKEPGVACAVLTADCLPLLICDRQGTKVAAIHAGWRGLLAGIILNCLQAANFEPGQTLVWAGPAIGANAYQVGEEIKRAFTESADFQSLDVDSAFKKDRDGKFLCDLYQLAKLQLAGLGVTDIYGGDQCTYTEKQTYFSYRRDGQTGRMVSLIWICSE